VNHQAILTLSEKKAIAQTLDVTASPQVCREAKHARSYLCQLTKALAVTWEQTAAPDSQGSKVNPNILATSQVKQCVVTLLDHRLFLLAFAWARAMCSCLFDNSKEPCSVQCFVTDGYEHNALVRQQIVANLRDPPSLVLMMPPAYIYPRQLHTHWPYTNSQQRPLYHKRSAAP